MPAPFTLSHSRRYPYSQQWKAEYDAAIRNLGGEQFIKWLPQPTARSNPSTSPYLSHSNGIGQADTAHANEDSPYGGPQSCLPAHRSLLHTMPDVRPDHHQIAPGNYRGTYGPLNIYTLRTPMIMSHIWAALPYHSKNCQLATENTPMGDALGAYLISSGAANLPSFTTYKPSSNYSHPKAIHNVTLARFWSHRALAAD